MTVAFSAWAPAEDSDGERSPGSGERRLPCEANLGFRLKDV